MVKFDTYRETFPNACLSRKPNGVLEVALYTDGGKLVFNGHTHEQFVHLFHVIGEDHGNRVVILTGRGDAFMDAISPEGSISLPRKVTTRSCVRVASFSRTSSTSRYQTPTSGSCPSHAG
jgi:hypothetical protein